MVLPSYFAAVVLPRENGVDDVCAQLLARMQPRVSIFHFEKKTRPQRPPASG